MESGNSPRSYAGEAPSHTAGLPRPKPILSVFPGFYKRGIIGVCVASIRAVSNMLGIAVDWDQDTKTVLLNVENTDANHTDTTTEPVKGEDIDLLTYAGTIAINTGDEDGAYKALKMLVSGMMKSRLSWHRSSSLRLTHSTAS